MPNKVYITDEQKAVKTPPKTRLLIRRCCNAVLLFEKFVGDAEVSVTITDNNGIKALNTNYRDKKTATDVLSFPLGNGNAYDKNLDTGAFMLGDIVISLEKAQEQARDYGHTLQREVAFLTVHSMFHLLGYDHENGGLEAVRMREREEAVLLKLGQARTFSYGVSQT